MNKVRVYIFAPWCLDIFYSLRSFAAGKFGQAAPILLKFGGVYHCLITYSNVEMVTIVLHR